MGDNGQATGSDCIGGFDMLSLRRAFDVHKRLC